jgi:hypothetical protein
MPMLKAALEQVLEWDPARIQNYTRGLTQDLVEEVEDLSYVLKDELWRGSHLTGLGLPPPSAGPRTSERLPFSSKYLYILQGTVNQAFHPRIQQPGGYSGTSNNSKRRPCLNHKPFRGLPTQQLHSRDNPFDLMAPFICVRPTL